jgi:predicted mannosyl-3-phosphoglycerate phosphatase (HAD superfamily)
VPLRSDCLTAEGIPFRRFVLWTLDFRYNRAPGSPIVRAHNTVVFCAIDEFIPISAQPLLGFPRFLDGLSSAGIPCVWVSSRSRHQLDSAIRKLGHTAPFIAEGGSGVFLPEDYFHLKPERTVRLGRFTCIPVASQLPAAAEALEGLAEETGIAVVTLRSLSSRELTQNTGLSRDAAEALRHRDFDELFFFAGASADDIQRFQNQALQGKLVLRQSGAFWSLACGASLVSCVRQLQKLYDRAMHAHTFSIAVAQMPAVTELVPRCDRGLALASRNEDTPPEQLQGTLNPPPRILPLLGADTWELALETIQNRQFLARGTGRDKV